MFLENTLTVPTSGNPPVKPACRPNRGFWVIDWKNPASREYKVTHGRTSHYCIARALELWFERLDFDAS